MDCIVVGCVRAQYAHELCAGCNRVRNKYNLSVTGFATLMSVQRCNSCGSKFKSRKDKHFDHCHDTGRIRGVLCMSCNVALGHLRDDVDRVRLLLQYAERTC